jgi:hypothetical protein
MKNDSGTTGLRLMGLKPATYYECVVKAGNQYGTSMLSKPVRFKTNTEDYIAAASSLGKIFAFNSKRARASRSQRD